MNLGSTEMKAKLEKKIEELRNQIVEAMNEFLVEALVEYQDEDGSSEEAEDLVLDADPIDVADAILQELGQPTVMAGNFVVIDRKGRKRKIKDPMIILIS